MTAINLALRNLYGYVVWGNSLGLEKRLVYRTGFNLRGVIREISLENCPAPVQQSVNEATVSPPPGPDARPSSTKSKGDDEPPAPGKQLRLF